MLRAASGDKKFGHAGAGRHPGVVLAGEMHNLDSRLRGNDDNEKGDFKSTQAAC